MQAHVGRLFDQAAPILGPEGEHLFDQPLTHDGVAVLAHLGLHEELGHVLEPDAALIDVVLVIAAAIGAPAHDYLLVREGEPAVAVVEDDAYLCHPLCGAFVAAAEDDVLRLSGADDAVGLLAEHPADRVGDVGLAGAIGTDDAGDARTKLERKG